MHIEINDKTPLVEIQSVFSAYYPYLKIEFYGRRHKKYEMSDEKYMIEPNILIGDIKAAHVSGVLEMMPSSRVADVEKEFLQRFGLSVQVFRREKDSWEQTAGMDDFTLKELNETGRNSSDEVILSEYEKGFEEPENDPGKIY
jgi:hypothetical protein